MFEVESQRADRFCEVGLTTLARPRIIALESASLLPFPRHEPSTGQLEDDAAAKAAACAESAAELCRSIKRPVLVSDKPSCREITIAVAT